MAFLVDIPLCTTEGIPDFNRGYVERYRHFDLATQAALPETQRAERAQEGKGKGLVLVTRAGSRRRPAREARRVRELPLHRDLRGRVEQLRAALRLGRVRARVPHDQ